MTELLDNIFWHSLVGEQARFASGDGAARRYAPGFSPIVGFAEPQRPDFDALVPYCLAGEHFYVDGWSGKVPADWVVDVESTMVKMVWKGDLPLNDEAPDAIPIEPQHLSQVLELAALTRPGPFGPRTIELGEYFGYFDRDRLMAMTGERTHSGALREVSGVCTHPDFQGRGLAKQLMLKVIRRQMLRGQTPFLHVMSDNHSAHGLYQRMGFVDYRVSVVRVVSLR
ncbi:MAG: GNAT family N-acetyltransferase [Tahibacter sp.]